SLIFPLRRESFLFAPRATRHAPRATHHAPRTTSHAPRTTHHAPRATRHASPVPRPPFPAQLPTSQPPFPARQPLRQPLRTEIDRRLRGPVAALVPVDLLRVARGLEQALGLRRLDRAVEAT